MNGILFDMSDIVKIDLSQQIMASGNCKKTGLVQSTVMGLTGMSKFIN
jgi:hypothetical protein